MIKHKKTDAHNKKEQDFSHSFRQAYSMRLFKFNAQESESPGFDAPQYMHFIVSIPPREHGTTFLHTGHSQFISSIVWG